MPLQKGDRVTLGIAPTIEIAPYKYLKSTVSVTIDIASSEPAAVEAQLDDANVQLRKLVARAILLELNVTNDVLSALSGGMDSLVAHCQKEVDNAYPDKAEPVVEASPAPVQPPRRIVRPAQATGGAPVPGARPAVRRPTPKVGG